jgi:hypothetical protein
MHVTTPIGIVAAAATPRLFVDFFTVELISPN